MKWGLFLIAIGGIFIMIYPTNNSFEALMTGLCFALIGGVISIVGYKKTVKKAKLEKNDIINDEKDKVVDIGRKK